MQLSKALSLYTVSVALLFTSCGKFDRLEDGGFTEVSFSSPRSGQYQTASTLTNGILITAYSASYVTNIKLTDETSNVSIVLPNGSYSFYAFGYGYSIDTSGTDVRCAVTGGANPVVLNGNRQTVLLEFKQSNCANAAFAPSAAYLDANTSSTLANSGPIFGEFDFVHCSTAAGTNFGTITSTQTCSTVGGGISASNPSVSKYQVIFPIFKYQNGQFTRLGEAYRSACTNSFPSGSGGTAISQYIRYPVGASSLPYAFPMEIETFSESACTSTPIMANRFHKGVVFGGDPEGSVYGTALANTTGGTNRVRVFLRAQ
jgi:hypothetical protein